MSADTDTDTDNGNGTTLATTPGGDTKPAQDIAVSFRNVSIVFGDNPYKALPLMETGQSRSDIQKATGQVLGVHDCSLDVAEGEILVLMGLSGSGKSTLPGNCASCARRMWRWCSSNSACCPGAACATMSGWALNWRACARARGARRSTSSWSWSACRNGLIAGLQNCRAGCSSGRAVQRAGPADPLAAARRTSGPSGQTSADDHLCQP